MVLATAITWLVRSHFERKHGRQEYTAISEWLRVAAEEATLTAMRFDDSERRDYWNGQAAAFRAALHFIDREHRGSLRPEKRKR